MIIEFRVKNFSSIRDEQKLSLSANKDGTYNDTHIVNSGIRTPTHLVRSSVLYGPNASGKSNLINAMAFMQSVVAGSATMREGQPFRYPSFKLDKKCSKQPSEFEITFINQGVRYQYGFALLPERVVEEWLLVYKTSKPQVWFSRKIDPDTDKDSYEFSSHLTGRKKLWQESTRTNALFLSKAVDLNSEQLRPIFLWIVENLIIIGAGHQPVFDYSIAHVQTDDGKQEILDLLSSADMSITDLSLESRKMKQLGLYFEDGTPTHTVTESETIMPVFFHQAENGSASFELSEESTGTQRLFAFAGLIINVLKKGCVLIVDELDGSLHTLMVRHLINVFHSHSTNKMGAQLIFSTHDVALLNMDVFRRDQIWFLEKDRTQATMLYPLTDFCPRKNEALERGYLMGRYGALPFFSEFTF